MSRTIRFRRRHQLEPRREDIGIDHELEAEHEATIERLFEMDEEAREWQALLAAARKKCRRNRIKFTPSDEVTRQCFRINGHWVRFVYEGDRVLFIEEEFPGSLARAPASGKKQTTDHRK